MRNEATGEKLQTYGLNGKIKLDRKKWQEHLERIEETWLPFDTKRKKPRFRSRLWQMGFARCFILSANDDDYLYFL